MILASLLLAALPVQAQPLPEQPVEKPKERKICRSYPVIGNRARVDRICHTRAEWQAVDESHQKYGADLLTRSQRGSTNGM